MGDRMRKPCFTNYIPHRERATLDEIHECQICVDAHLCHAIKLIQNGGRIPESMIARLVELGLLDELGNKTPFYNRVTGEDILATLDDDSLDDTNP